MSRSLCGLVVGALLTFPLACDGGDAAPAGKAADDSAAKKEAEDAEKKAAEVKAAEEARAREEAAKVEEAKAEEDYAAAKPTLEPLARLPKKHPKGFAAACVGMLEEYDAFMKRTLEGEALAAWTPEEAEERFRGMRRDCHNREVEVVVCEGQVLKKAPAGTTFGHVMRVCQEKFGG